MIAGFLTFLIMICIAVVIPLTLGYFFKSPWVSILGMLAGVTYLGASDQFRLVTTCESKKVVEVGGCGRFGDCRVALEDGTLAYAKYPIAGYPSRICTTTEKSVWWEFK